jgi:heptosyltransferase-2
MTKILVIGPSWIGDMVLAQPMLKLLRARHGDAVIDVLAPRWTLPLVERMPEVRRGIDMPVGHGDLRLAARWKLARQLRSERYDQAIVLPNSLKSALVPFFAGIRVRTGYVGEGRFGLLSDARRLPAKRLPQIAHRYAELALPRGEALRLPLPTLDLRVDEAARRDVLTRLGVEKQRPAVALCPGAEYGPAKRWPARYFAELAQGIAARGCSVWLIGSPGDAPLGAEIARAAGGACRNLCGETTLGEAIDVLSATGFVVTNDSGLMHVAAAFGKPLIALYGSSSPEFTPPLSPNAQILRLELPCSPCFERVCPLGHFNCMNQLLPDRVLEEIDFDRIS